MKFGGWGISTHLNLHPPEFRKCLGLLPNVKNYLKVALFWDLYAVNDSIFWTITKGMPKLSPLISLNRPSTNGYAYLTNTVMSKITLQKLSLSPWLVRNNLWDFWLTAEVPVRFFLYNVRLQIYFQRHPVLRHPLNIAKSRGNTHVNHLLNGLIYLT